MPRELTYEDDPFLFTENTWKDVEKPLGMREVFVLRERARKCLIDFIASISGWPTRSQFRHFLGMNATESGSGVRAPITGRPAPVIKGKLKIDKNTAIATESGQFRFDSTGHPAPPASARMAKPTPEEYSVYLTTFFRLLEASVLDPPATHAELDILLRALNDPLQVLLWSKRGIVGYSYGPRGCAEHLVSYLNLISECGTVHGFCGDCGTMFLRQRDRKFCHDCSKKHQTYQYRKKYLREKKKEYYQRDIAEDRQFRDKTKTQKGVVHGKARTKK